MEINKFQFEYDFLSNFYLTPVLYEGILYPSSEHAYQAAKTISTDERLMILYCKTPGQAKRKGRSITLRPAWDSIRFDIMLDILRSKFENKDLAEKLLRTEGSVLVEGNYWHDNYWGECKCEKCENVHSSNYLGLILMIVRAELKKKEKK